MKKILLTLIVLILGAGYAQAQFAWTEPTQIDPEDTVILYVDVSLDPTCGVLAGDPGPLYIWTWQPAEGTRPAETQNGSWSSSNENLRMTHETAIGPDVWSFKMVPTEFYGVPAAEVYNKDISFLAKKKDGGGGGDCTAGGGDFKTSDIIILVDPPSTGPRKIYSFPEPVAGEVKGTADDVFTLYYDNKLEEKPSLIGGDDFYVFASAVTDANTTIRISSLTQVVENPDLQMIETEEGSGLFKWSIIPDEAYPVPAGQTVVELVFKILAKPYTGASATVEGEFRYPLSCP